LEDVKVSTGAFIRLARSVSASLEQFAVELETSQQETEQVLEDQPPPDPEEGRSLGKRQRQIVRLTALATETGLKTAEISVEIGNNDVPNTYLALRALERAGVVELIAGSEPQRWRLAPRYRPTADPYLKVAGLVRRGEWTTYGDVSIAQRGDSRAARAVGRAAATLDDFPNPHRILLEGGRIPEGWRDGRGNGPEECRRQLENEGVSFTDDGRANMARRVTWDVLRERLNQTPNGTRGQQA
jgi:alkylated DNA nucleotide flippase Atl1